MSNNIKLNNWHALDESSVQFQGTVCRPVILAEFHIDGRRWLHSMFNDPADGEWKPVAFIAGAILHMVDAEYVEAMTAMNFQQPQAEWN